MMQYRDIIDGVKEKIISDNGKYKNWVIIGDNSSGKSEILKEIVESVEGERYYIDSVNRFFDIENVSLKEEEVTAKVNSDTVVQIRLQEDKFNLNDSFGTTEKIWDIYPIYKNRLTELIRNFLSIDFKVERIRLSFGGESNPKVFIDNTECKLSNGYQAIIRLFAELLFFCEVSGKKGIIIIDEIDEFLSPETASKIFSFIYEEFSESRFIISTHSSDLIASSSEFNLVILENDLYQIYDGNDFCSITDVDTLLLKTYKGDYGRKTNEIDKSLERLLNAKVSSMWTEEDNEIFRAINVEGLTNIQKFLYRQIKEWDI